MTDKDLQKILTDTGSFSAAYKPLPLALKPEGCSIPALLPGSPGFPTLQFPSIVKPCNIPFTEFPVVPEPFTIPESCPTGITFNTKTVSIFSSLTDTRPSGSVDVGVARNPNDLCSYDLNLPDIVIPCFPAGPQLLSTASVTVVDLNSDQTTTTPFGFIKDSAMACRWILDGNLTFTIPRVPCPAGVMFNPGNLQITSTCPRVIENKTIEIRQNESNPCSYDLTMPALKIPCYPDGPKINSTLNFEVTDSADTTLTTLERDKHFPITLGPVANQCCTYGFNGDVTIDVPCHKGITIVEQPITVIQPVMRDAAGHPIATSISTPPTIPIGGHPVQDICHIGITLPPVIIPCYPDGINFKGAVTFKTHADNHVLASKIDLSNESLARRKDKPCEWSLDPIQIDLPTAYCPGGFTFTSQHPSFPLKIYANRNTPIPFGVLDLNGNPVDDGTGSGGGANPDTSERYHTLKLIPYGTYQNGVAEKDCGAILGGTLNLGLAEFAVACKSLIVGDKNTISIYLADPQHQNAPINFSLLPTTNGCGFEFSTASLDLPVIACPAGFLGTKTDLSIYMGASTTKLDHSITLAPIDNKNPACGLQLSGILRIPASGSSGGGSLITSPWHPNKDFNPGDSAHIVFPEGGRCVYNAIGSNPITPNKPPGVPAGDDAWECVACNGEKVFPPYKVVRCKEMPKMPDGQTIPDANKKSVVKVVPRSYLYDSLKDKALLHIYGLNTPFFLAPNEKVWLDITFDGSGPNIVFQYATINHGVSWDADIGNVASVGDQQYKTLRRADATVLSTAGVHDTNDQVTVGYTDMKQEDKDLLKHMYDSALYNITQLPADDNRPRQIKAYILIAKASDGMDSAKDQPPDLDGLCLQQGTTQYVVEQSLDAHLVLVGRNADNVPVRIPEKAIGSNPNVTTLKCPTITTELEGTGNAKKVKVKFATDDQTSITGKTFKLGTGSTDIQVYYTTDGSIPTVNTQENQKSSKWVAEADGWMRFDETELGPRVAWAAFAPTWRRSEPGSKLWSEIDPNATPPK